MTAFANVQLYTHQREWKKAQQLFALLSRFQASVKNAKLKVYLLQQMGKQKEAMDFREEYMLKC